MTTDAEITDAILRLLEARGPGKSISPTDVACALDPAWRPLLGRVRAAAVSLALTGRIHILRKGQPVGPVGVRGVIRLSLHAPDLHAPDLHAPDLHAPDLHAPDLHAPDLHAPDLRPPEETP